MLPAHHSKFYSVSQEVERCCILGSMRHHKRRQYMKFLRTHALAVLTLILAFVGFIWINYSLQSQQLAVIEQTNTTSLNELGVLQEKIDDIIAARKAAEERARQIAAARETAQTVLETSVEDAALIDSTSCNNASAHINPTLVDVLVNKRHCIQPLTYVPGDLVTVYGATLSAKASDNFATLYEAAQAAGVPVAVTSSYRSYATQVSTYQYWVGISGASGADTYSARPGYSEHQTGFAVDLATPGGCSLDCFGTTDQYQWMQKNAATFGFIQRYYAGYEDATGYIAEEWHYRYVGPTIAMDMKKKGIKTLETYWNLPGGNYY